MKKCPYCGQNNKDNAEHCERCSASLTAEKQKEKQTERSARRINKEE